MISMGLGLEHIGSMAMRRPGLFLAILLLACVFSAFQIPKVRFDGDITVVLPSDSEAFRNYLSQKNEFRDFSRDVTLLVQSNRLLTSSGLEDLRSLQLELAVGEEIENVFTMFSIPSPNPETGELSPFFPEELGSDEEARALVGRLLETYPQAASLVSPESNTAVMVVTFSDNGTNTSDASRLASVRSYGALKKAAQAAAPPDFALHFTGLTPISVTIINALIGDQLKMTGFGLLLGMGIAFYVFRSIVAAVICAIPPALTALWSLAVFGFLGIPVTYLSTVLPTLALILAFADGIVMYYRWHELNAARPALAENLAEAIRRVGPATSLTSITTLLAFLSFYFSPGAALKEFAILGVAAVTLAYLAVIVGLPVTGRWFMRAGLIRPSGARKPAFSRVGAGFAAFVRPRAPWVAATGFVLACLLSVMHFYVRPEFRLTDYLPLNSETREAETMANSIIGGRAMLFISAPAAVPGTPFLAENLARLGEIETAISPAFKPERMVSALAIGKRMATPGALAELDRQFAKASPAARATYLSRDGAKLLVGIRIASDQSIQTTNFQIGELRSRLSGLAYGQHISITGFDVLMAKEFTGLIQQLRNSLLIAIFMGVGIIGIATRSFVLAAASLTPNLLPIFAVEMFVWFRGGGINMSEVIALTIAFGIAVDNAVHILNVREDLCRKGRKPAEALGEAMTEVGPALVASCTIICVSALVTQISVLPLVPIVGKLIIATLIVALVSNLAILPANLWSLERRKRDE